MRTDIPDIVENEHVDQSLRVLQSRLQHPRSKQHSAEEAVEHQVEIEAETRVEEGTAAELKSQVETVINKDEMIDVIGCTRGHGFEGVVTLWSCTRLPRKTHCSLRKDACTGTWHPAAFSGKCPVQVNQVSITKTMLDEARGATDWSSTLAPQGGEQAVRGHSS